MSTLVLLSGGMDSAVCLFLAAESYPHPIHALTIDYGQVARKQELHGAEHVFITCASQNPAKLGRHILIRYPVQMFGSGASILGDKPITHYDTQEEAIRGTPTETSQIPLRNAIFASVAAHWLLTLDTDGGTVIMGIRGRPNGSEFSGFPDCTREFSDTMSEALYVGSGEKIFLEDPLNHYADTRKKTLQMAEGLPGCFEALKHTVSCYHGTRCGHCLPCLRRRQAFAELKRPDPAGG